jgi:PKD repeat protein
VGLSDAQVRQNYAAEQWRLTATLKPIASFTSNVTSGIAPLTVQFWDKSTGSPTAWQWQWGDGTANDTTINPVHTYTNPGKYTINLTVTNANGSSTIQRANYINATDKPENDNTSYVADGLYSYYNWTGDSGSTVTDNSGNRHNGTNSGSILNNDPVASRTFDGTAKIDIPDQPLAGWNGFTYETIIQPTNVTPGTKHGIIGQSYGRNVLYLDGSRLVIRIVNAGGYATEARSANVSFSKPVHVVMTYNNTTKYARLYINGAYVTQVQLSSYGSKGQVWQTFPWSAIANSYITGMGKLEGSISSKHWKKLRIR